MQMTFIDNMRDDRAANDEFRRSSAAEPIGVSRTQARMDVFL